MNKLSEINVNGTVYVPKDEAPEPSPVRIVILQRGWVMIGRFYQDGEHCMLTNAYVIRRWGTTKGLGELAAEGPKPETKLDKSSTVRFHELTVVAMLDCEVAKWPQL